MGQLATVEERHKELGRIIGTYEKQLHSVLPKHIPPERMMRVTLQAATQIPDLLQPKRWPTFIGSMLECAAVGLEPGVAGQCWILPYGKGDRAVAKLIYGYRGLVQLARRSRHLSAIFGRVVYEGDDFQYIDFPPRLDHVALRLPDGGEPSQDERGKMVRAYAAARFADSGHWQFEVMEAHEIEGRRKMSHGSHKPESPWQRFPEAMWRKTPLRELVKVLPFSVEDRDVQRAVDLDERAEIGLDQGLEVKIEDLPEVDEIEYFPAEESGE